MNDFPEFAKRRRHLLEKLQPGSIAILVAAPEANRNSDCEYLYRQNSDFYYVTGFPEPEAVAVFIPGRKEGEFILFNRERDLLLETWNGKRAGQQGACEIYGADQAFSITQLDQELPKLMEGRSSLYYALGRRPDFDARIIKWLEKIRAKVRRGAQAPSTVYNIEDLIHPMRLIKSSQEIAWMRKAAEISAQAHCRAMQQCRPGMREYELEAELVYTFIKNGSRAPAYNHIVGAGPNACILHYNDNNAEIASGDLVLIDAGAEYEYYAADITRTFPANGRFSPEQRAIYEVVLATQLAVIAILKPGLSWHKLEETAVQVMTEGLLNLGLLQGKLADLIKTQACKTFYLHSIGHWLGMDVHDVGSYKKNNEWRPLQTGMVFTVEPGIYIPAHSDVDAKWWNIGVRIEDDILITATGAEVLSSGVPKTIDEIEALMS
ncbi:MAG: Xaa-Pro aminopeptidase [Gammaproteobacteria bacterium]